MNGQDKDQQQYGQQYGRYFNIFVNDDADAAHDQKKLLLRSQYKDQEE